MSPESVAQMVKSLKESAEYWERKNVQYTAVLFREAADLIESLAASPSVPEGMVMVPREPTEAMLAAAIMHDMNDELSDVAADYAGIYRAMLDAATTAQGNAHPGVTQGNSVTIQHNTVYGDGAEQGIHVQGRPRGER